MLVTFRSTATDSITMFGDIATPLLHMMGASGKVPGALKAEDVPGALQRLEASIKQLESTHPDPQQTNRAAAPPAMNEDWADDEEEKDKDPPVELAVRAVPLIGLLRRAAAAKAEVMWE